MDRDQKKYHPVVTMFRTTVVYFILTNKEYVNCLRYYNIYLGFRLLAIITINSVRTARHTDYRYWPYYSSHYESIIAVKLFIFNYKLVHTEDTI